MDERLKNYAIGTLTIALLISLGFAVMPDDTHICRSLELGKYCDRLSSSMRTCYPTPGTMVGKKLCPEPWEEIMKEPEPKVIVRYDDSNIGAQFLCSPQGCTQIR